jgi:triosephosphate isomerase
MARQAGARCALVGHSERRHLFGETDEETARKCAAAFDAELVPVLCVGETIEERTRGESAAVVLRQLRAGVERLTPQRIGAMVIAYEPVWAIGTGRTATPDDAAEMHATIREALVACTGGGAGGIPILYGGSVNETNARTLLEAPDVDGLLVGGASLEVERWTHIVCSLDRDPQRA